MKKNGFLSLISLLILFLSANMVSCSDKNDLSTAVTPPSASGVVILSENQKVIKGQEFVISFRVNPSGAVINKSSVELDAFLSDTYRRIPPESADGPSSKASYVKPSEFFECVDLVRDSNAIKEPLEGQWKLRIRTKGEGNFMNKTSLYVVLNYLDVNGKQQRISSAFPTNIQICPTLEEGLVVGYAKGQTFRAASNNAVLPYIVMVDCNTYRNEKGDQWTYERNLVTSVGVSTSDSLFQIKNEFEKGYLSLMPLNVDKWNNFEKSTDISVSADINVSFTDISESERKVVVPAKYYKSHLTLPYIFSAAEVNAKPDVSKFKFNVNKEMANLGITPDFNVNLWRLLPSVLTIIRDPVDIFLSGVVITGSAYTETLNTTVILEKFDGLVSPGTELDTVGMIYTTFPENTLKIKFRLIDAKIAIPITITE